MTPKRTILTAGLVSCLVAAGAAIAGNAPNVAADTPGEHAYIAAAPMPHNWPMPPHELERRFANDDFKIREVKSAGGGVTGASRLTIEYPDGKTMKVKWKAVPGKSADGWNNSPRKELACYQMQRWLFDENDYVVPTAMPHCIPMDDYVHINPEMDPSVAGSTCVLGVIAAWLNDVTAPEPSRKFYDEKRAARDPLYARYMADFNLLTYLVDHRDGRSGNLLTSTDPADPRVFAVDNGIAFEPFPFNFLVTNWNRIRVPWLRRATVDRLRRVGQADLDRLGVLAELDADEKGILRPVTPGPNLDAHKGARVQTGHVQFGLTSKEIENVHERIVDLLAKVDAGKIPLR